MKKIILLLCIFTCVACQENKVNTEKQFGNASEDIQNKDINIVGLWQAAPYVASGWDDCYQFFEDGQFTFNYNQMICDKRTISFSGTWMLEDDFLKLSITQKIIIEGGELVPATGSCGSEYEIEGGEIKTILIEEHEILEIQITDYGIDTENMEMETMKFDGIKFWRMGSDPDIY